MSTSVRLLFLLVNENEQDAGGTYEHRELPERMVEHDSEEASRRRSRETTPVYERGEDVGNELLMLGPGGA